MQAALPDINAAFVKTRTQVHEAIKNGFWNVAVIGIEGMNALFPEKYQVVVDSNEYYKSIQESKFIVCSFCNNECVFNKIRQYDLLLNNMDNFFTGKSSQRMWDCLECNMPNEFNQKNMIIERKQEPYYLKMMPAPPMSKRGISGRTTFDAECQEWCRIALREIEHQIGLYRIEYIAQHESDEIYHNTVDD